MKSLMRSGDSRITIQMQRTVESYLVLSSRVSTAADLSRWTASPYLLRSFSKPLCRSSVVIGLMDKSSIFEIDD